MYVGSKVLGMKSGKRFLVGFDLIKATPSKHHLRRGDDVEKVIRTASEKVCF